MRSRAMEDCARPAHLICDRSPIDHLDLDGVTRPTVLTRLSMGSSVSVRVDTGDVSVMP